MYELAFHLKKTLSEIQAMPYPEFLGWFNYLERRPVDWRDDDRTHKLLQVQGVKEKAWQIFPSLEAIYRPPAMINEDGLNVASLKGSMFFSKMLSSKGGDALDL